MDDKMKTNTKVRITSLYLLAGAVFLASCSELRSQYYVGELVPIEEAELGEESIWQLGCEVYYVRCIDTNHGVAATLEWDNGKDEYTVISYPLIISELGDHVFLNVKKDDYYTILRVAGSCGNSAMLFTVDEEVMKKAIADGSVKAHASNGHIILDGTKEEQDEYIANNIHTVFAMDCGRIARLLSEKEESKEKKQQKKDKQKPAPASSDEKTIEV